MAPTHWILILLMLCMLAQLGYCLSQEFPDYGEHESDSRSLKKKKKKLQCLLHLHSQRRSYEEERTLGLLGTLTQFETGHDDDQDYNNDPCKDVFHGLLSTNGVSSSQSYNSRNPNYFSNQRTYVRQLNRLFRPVNRALRPFYRLIF